MIRMAISLVAALLVASSATATTAAAVPGKVTVGAAAKKQRPVTFDHAKHAAIVKTCDTCHHTQKGLKKGDAKVEVQKCSACHLDPKPKVPSMREMNLQKNPFHAVCLKCHKQEKKGPVACAGCHVKK